MSSRLSTSAASRSREVVRGLEQLAAVVGVEVEVEAEQGGDGGLGRRERRAEVVADGGQQRGADLVGLGERRRLGGRPAQPDVVEHDGRLRGERADQPLVLGLRAAARTGPGRAGRRPAPRCPRRWAARPPVRRSPPAAQPSSLRSSSVTEVEAEGLPHASSISDERLLAAEHAAGEVGQGARLGGGPRRLPGTSGRQVDRRADQRRHQHEDEEREGVVGLADGQGVQRRREVVVEQRGAQRRRRSGPGHRPPTSATTTVSRRKSSMSLTRFSSPRNGVSASVSSGGSTTRERVAAQLAPAC